ncbi:helix-turn-helix domain-containing protein [Streptomyces sp. NBC_00557]|uniref:helix-turn-helix domain-containing protein n=1 Tax=Streptomyces sp. NBC_00557 TaxID=2975776 RepID=UPI002E7FD166|nr:helix-turn-helix domain-containing protein [Streptomyces sp. NBC_00557]WUC36345.1 XRE family transcriptional regulator [Streptomyces sp. NBC_00557]
MDKPERTEDLAQLLARLKDTYRVSDSEIARRIGVAPATVNSWVHRKRGGGRGPKREALQALAREFPKFTEEEIFRAAGRQSPGPLSAEAEARILELWRGLTEDQQRAKEVELRALNEMNRTGQ